jgi:hypothetical protein
MLNGRRLYVHLAPQLIEHDEVFLPARRRLTWAIGPGTDAIALEVNVGLTYLIDRHYDDHTIL